MYVRQGNVIQALNNVFNRLNFLFDIRFSHSFFDIRAGVMERIINTELLLWLLNWNQKSKYFDFRDGT